MEPHQEEDTMPADGAAVPSQRNTKAAMRVVSHVFGCVRSFDCNKGFGFIIVLSPGDHYLMEIFVHSTGLMHTAHHAGYSRQRMLFNNECVAFNIADTGNPDPKRKYEAIDVSGYNGTRLMCDNSAIVFSPPRTGGASSRPRAPPHSFGDRDREQPDRDRDRDRDRDGAHGGFRTQRPAARRGSPPR
jgi:hypothetical protein